MPATKRKQSMAMEAHTLGKACFSFREILKDAWQVM
jgi:hypothetical protein